MQGPAPPSTRGTRPRSANVPTSPPPPRLVVRQCDLASGPPQQGLGSNLSQLPPATQGPQIHVPSPEKEDMRGSPSSLI